MGKKQPSQSNSKQAELKKTKQIKKPEIESKNASSQQKWDCSFFEQYSLRIIKQIGGGSYGSVYHAKSTQEQNPHDYAVKINYANVSRKIIFSEIGFLFLMRKKTNLPKLHRVFMHEEDPIIVMNYFNYQPFCVSVCDIQTYFFKFSIEDIKHYMIEMFKGLKNLKDLGIFHRDIKPDNFLYDTHTKKGMIIDFGLSQLDLTFLKHMKSQLEKNKNLPSYANLSETYSIYDKIQKSLTELGKNKTGTMVFMPLQSLLKKSDQSYSSDMWPVGVIMLQFLFKKYILFENIEIEGDQDRQYTSKKQYIINFLIQLSIIFGTDEVVKGCQGLGMQLQLPEGIPKISIPDYCRVQGYDHVCEDLLTKLLCIDPKKRITVEDALMHPFFDEVRDTHMRCSFWKTFKRQMQTQREIKQQQKQLQQQKEMKEQKGMKQQKGMEQEKELEQEQELQQQKESKQQKEIGEQEKIEQEKELQYEKEVKKFEQQNEDEDEQLLSD